MKINTHLQIGNQDFQKFRGAKVQHFSPAYGRQKSSSCPYRRYVCMYVPVVGVVGCPKRRDVVQSCFDFRIKIKNRKQKSHYFITNAMFIIAFQRVHHTK